MEILNFVHELFRLKYKAILDDIESSIFVYVEELILSKDIPINDEINYGDSAYQIHLKELLDSILFGLKSLNISENIITEVFLGLDGFAPEPHLSTYLDWIAQEFQPRIQNLIFTEVLKYLIQVPSVFQGLVDYGLLSEEHLRQLQEIRRAEPNLVQFLNWFFEGKNIVTKKIQDREMDYAQMIQFREPEKDLQSMYFMYKMTEILGLTHLVEKSPISEYLLLNTESWVQQNPNISEKYPMTLYCGVYLGQQLNLPIKKDYVKGVLKKILVRLVNNFDAPLFEDTFLTYYVLEACRILDLKLTQKLVTGITRFNANISPDVINTYSLNRIEKIYDAYLKLEVIDMIPPEFHQQVIQILAKRKREDLYYNYDIDFLASGEGLGSAFRLLKIMNQISDFNLRATLDFIPRNIKDNLLMFDFNLTGQLSDIQMGMELIQELLELGSLKDELSEYIIGEPYSNLIGSSTESATDSFEAYSSESPSEVELDGMDSSMDVSIPSMEDTSNPIIEDYIPEEVEFSTKRPLPKDFWDFFGDFPALYADIVDELRLNIEAVVKPPKDMYDDLSVLFQWINCLKILNIAWPVDKNTIFANTLNFRKDNGFGIPESDFPDPMNTFYGLCIYSELNLMEQLNLYKIQEYLLGEINNLDEHLVLINDYLFMSLRILARFQIPMNDYTYLIPRVITTDIQKKTDVYNNLTDMIHIINFIKAVDPMYNISIYADDYLKDVQIALEEDGSINKRPSETAAVLITLHELGLQGVEEAKFAIKYLQYDSNYFTEDVREQPIGWEKDSLGYKIELRIFYWTLMALTLIYPAVSPMQKSRICPQCYAIFPKKPKFCNRCGHSF